MTTTSESFPGYTRAGDHMPVLHWNYAIKGLLLRGETSLLVGPSNSGKSAFAGLLARAITSGETFAGNRVRRGLVVHVAAEAPRSILDRSLAWDGAGASEWRDRYFVRSSGLDLGDPEETARLLEELKHIARRYEDEIVLLVFDTLILCMGGRDENASGEMAAVVEGAKRLAREMDAHVMLVHHTGKDAERGGRNSSALRTNVDTELALRPDQEAGLVRVVTEKQRSLSSGASLAFCTEPFRLGLDEDGEELTVARARLVDDATAVRKARGAGHGGEAPREVAIRTALRGMALAPSSGVEIRSDDVIARLPEDILDGIASVDGKRKAVARVLDKLAADPDGGIARAETGPMRWRWRAPLRAVSLRASDTP